MPSDKRPNRDAKVGPNFPYMTDRNEDFQLAEVEEILRYPDPSKIITEPPVLPKGGEVYLYRPMALDRRVRDHYWWVNRGNNFHSKGQKRPSIMKTYFSLKDRNGGRKSDCLNGFRRHIYRLADAREDEALIFIHYLGDETLHKPVPHGNTKVRASLWNNQQSVGLGSTSRNTTAATTAIIKTENGFPTVMNTGERYQKIIPKVKVRNTTTAHIGSSKRGSIPFNVKIMPSSINMKKPRGISSQLTIQKNTNNRKRLETHQMINNPHLLRPSETITEIPEATINLTQYDQAAMPRPSQCNVQPSSHLYIQQSLQNPVVSKKIKLSTPSRNIDQHLRLQRIYRLNRHHIKPRDNQVINLTENQNDLQLAANTPSVQQAIATNRHLSSSLSAMPSTKLETNSPQLILQEALQKEPEIQSFISQNNQNRNQEISENKSSFPSSSSKYLFQNNPQQTIPKKSSSLQNSLTGENSETDSTLPINYEKFFDEASKLPRMGCDVFVLVSYPGCKPAYWGTEKYIKKFENSECLLPFSASKCLSIRLKGLSEKPNLLAKNLESSQPVWQQLNNIHPSNPDPNLDIVIKEELQEDGLEEMDASRSENIIKQEHSDLEDCHPVIQNVQSGIIINNLNNDLVTIDNSHSIPNNSSYKQKSYQQTQQSQRSHYSNNPNNYFLSVQGRDCLENKLFLGNKDITNFPKRHQEETNSGTKNSSELLEKDTPFINEPILRVSSQEPNHFLIKVESLTDDHSEVNNLVYTEYG